MRQPSNQRGFTLIEVLVATLITALVMVSIMATLWSSLSGRDTVYNLTQEQSAGVAVLGLIERDLQALHTYNVAAKRVFLGKNHSSKGMEADSFDFVATTNSKIPRKDGERDLRADLCEVGYRLRPNPDKPDFLQIWRRESFFLDDKPFEGGDYTLLYDQVKSFNVTYYAEPGTRADSLDDWSAEEKDGLPFAMKIEMEVELRPRLEMEFTSGTGAQKRAVRFTRNFVFPSALNQSLKISLVPAIPQKAPDLDAVAGGAAPNAAGGTVLGSGSSPPPGGAGSGQPNSSSGTGGSLPGGGSAGPGTGKKGGG